MSKTVWTAVKTFYLICVWFWHITSKPFTKPQVLHFFWFTLLYYIFSKCIVHILSILYLIWHKLWNMKSIPLIHDHFPNCVTLNLFTFFYSRISARGHTLSYKLKWQVYLLAVSSKEMAVNWTCNSCIYVCCFLVLVVVSDVSCNWFLDLLLFCPSLWPKLIWNKEQRITEWLYTLPENQWIILTYDHMVSVLHMGQNGKQIVGLFLTFWVLHTNLCSS